MPESYFDKLADLGFMVVTRRNNLGTHTMFAVRPGELVKLSELPEWRIVDFTGDEAAKGARMLYEKLTYTGMYENWDEKMVKLGMYDKLVGFAHRPADEIFEVGST
jgi:hypothetical protein